MTPFGLVLVCVIEGLGNIVLGRGCLGSLPQGLGRHHPASE